jgi:nitrite reductase/ring-hydroxylating ferredoxin subunit
MTEHAALATGWVPVCSTDQLAQAGRAAIDLPSGERCLVVDVAGTLRAVIATCTHRALSIEGGPVRAGVITCPWHRARFDLETGRASHPATVPLKTFDVTVIGDVVCVREKRTTDERDQNLRTDGILP